MIEFKVDTKRIKKIAIAGKFLKSRVRIKKEYEKKGFKVVSVVTNENDYLLVGLFPGSKLIKALRLKANIIYRKSLILKIYYCVRSLFIYDYFSFSRF